MRPSAYDKHKLIAGSGVGHQILLSGEAFVDNAEE